MTLIQHLENLFSSFIGLTGFELAVILILILFAVIYIWRS